MKTEIDLKALWHKQEANDIPDIKDLFKKADGIKRKTRVKMVLMNLLLISASAYFIYIGFKMQHELLTTKIGIAMVVAGIITYLLAYDLMIPVVFKTTFAISLHEYLEQLISIKRREDFLNRVMINIYFVMFSIGMSMYLIQFVNGFWSSVLTYGLFFSWILFTWFYLRPCGVKRKQKPLIEMIAKLEELNKQLEER